MSNDYFKAQGWFKNYARSSEDSRGVFQQLVKEDEEAFRLASAETDKIKAMINKKFGSGSMKYGSEIPQPEIKTPQAIFEFSQRNPAAEGGRMRFDKGLSAKRKLDIIKFVTDFKEKNNRLPTKNEIRIDGKFDYQFIKDRIDDGSIETLSTSEAKKLGRKKVDLKEIGKKTSATKTKNQPYVVTEGASQTVGNVLDVKFPNEEIKNNYLEDLKKIYNEGYKRTIYKDPGVLTTKELAEKYFGKANDFTISKIGKMNTFFANQLGLSFENLPIETKSQEVAERRKEKITKGRKELTDREKLINTQQDNLVSEINKYYKEFPDEVINNKELTNAILSRMNDDGTIKLKTFDSEIEKNKYLKKMALSKSGVMSIDHLSDVKFGKKNVEFPINRQLIPTKTNQSIITKAKSLLSKNLDKTDEASQAIVKNVINNLNNLGQRVNVDGKIYGADILAAIDETKGTLPNMERSITKFNLNNVVKNSNFKINPSLIKTSNIDEIESYITDRTGKVKQPMFSSGFSGAYEMLSDDLKKIINSEGFKTFKAKIANPALKTAVGAAKLPTKIFGAADLVLGYLDYTNNRQKGFSKEDSTRHMVDAVLFGATSFGEKGDIEGVKKTAMQNGMSEEVFNNLVNINTNQKAMINRINESKAKFNESMDIIESGTADPVTEKMLIQKLKVDTKEFLTNTMKNIVDDSRSLNTNLQVQEAGAPININVDRQKAFSDLGESSREFVQKRIDASDPKVFEQGDTTMGKIGSTIKETVMQPDFYTGFFKKTKAQKDREDMEKLKIQDPTLYYKMLMSEGVDPRIKLNIPVQLEFEQKYPQFGTQLSDSLTQNKAEGGITSLRSKYEYKK